MKATILISAVLCIAAASAIPTALINAGAPLTAKSQFNSSNLGATFFANEFAKFKSKFNKVYRSADHEADRFVTFVNNLNFIRNHKSDSYTVAVNQFADMTHDEFKSFYLGYKPSSHTIRKLGHAALTASATPDLTSTPSSIDWVAKGAVTAVKNQGHCGSCWAFSTTGAIEGAIYNSYNVLESLSEEQLVQCDKVDSGCQGGSMDNGFTYAETNGLASEDDYAYTSSSGTTGTCQSSLTTTPAKHSKVASFVDVTPNSEAALKAAVAKGPVSVAIEADKQAFQFYSGGVIKATAGCGTSLDHGVLAVGYGTAGPDETDAGVMYWKVKNSWGPSWGEEGYVRLERTDSADSKGTCGIAMDASYPKVA